MLLTRLVRYSGKAWCNKHNGKLVEIRDFSRQYRQAIVDWSTEILYPQIKQTAPSLTGSEADRLLSNIP